ncbi:hypothetical protein OROMI_034911 [Orobanche minor]
MAWIQLNNRRSPPPTKSRLVHTIAKILHIQAVKSQEKTKKDQTKHAEVPSLGDEDEKLKNGAIINEAFLAKLFASISTVKSLYAQLQFSQSPYDADEIQSSDEAIVSELNNLSGLKQCYLKEQFNETSPERTLVLSEIQEQKSLLKTYEVTSKKLDFQLKLKDSEITFLEEKLAEANNDNKLLEKKLNSSGQIAVPDNIQFSDLKPSHFITYSRQVIKSIRSFVHLLIREMESSKWNLDSAASSIEPGISFWKPNHKCFVFESFLCKQMFDGFNCPNFYSKTESGRDNRRQFFAAFTELKSVRPGDYLAWKPKSTFALFCCQKYCKVVHPKMEASFFGNLDQRNLLRCGELPETDFFSAFCEMAKRVWLLHCLALSYEPDVTIFQVCKGSRFSEVYMESLSDEAFSVLDGKSETCPRVAFTGIPGFRIGKTILQCQVYLY